MFPTQTLTDSVWDFDSNRTNGGVAIVATSTTNWLRALTLGVGETGAEIRVDISIANGPAAIRLTRAAKSGEMHGLLQTDLTQVNEYVPLATISGSGTASQPGAGSILSLNIDPRAGEEIGFEFQQVSGQPAPTVRIYGSRA